MLMARPKGLPQQRRFWDNHPAWLQKFLKEERGERRQKLSLLKPEEVWRGPNGEKKRDRDSGRKECPVNIQ